MLNEHVFESTAAVPGYTRHLIQPWLYLKMFLRHDLWFIVSGIFPSDAHFPDKRGDGDSQPRQCSEYRGLIYQNNIACNYWV
jgi:hypothetical protein